MNQMAAVDPAIPPRAARPATGEPPVVRRLLIGLAALFLFLFVILPLLVVFLEAFRSGWSAYWSQIIDPRTWHAIKLSFVTAAFAVPLNTAFGLAAAWCVTKFSFRGKSVLVTLIDLPFAVSPVI